jgi:hypothetical protein
VNADLTMRCRRAAEQPPDGLSYPRHPLGGLVYPTLRPLGTVREPDGVTDDHRELVDDTGNRANARSATVCAV